MSVEKLGVIAISALLGSCAAFRSRKSRCHAGEALEISLSESIACPSEKRDEEQTGGLGKWILCSRWILTLHALVSCAYVWINTSGYGVAGDMPLVNTAVCTVLPVVLVLHMLGHMRIIRHMTVSQMNSPGSNQGDQSLMSVHLDEYTSVCAGRWIKDRDASESMDPVCDLMAIGGIMRFALQFIVGSDVHFSHGSKGDTRTHFSFAAFSVVQWFKIKESYPTWGQEVRHRRRDLRSGGMHGHMVLTNSTRFSPSRNREVNTPIIEITNEFGGYRPGTLREVFTWPEDGVMLIDSVITNEFGSARFTQIFQREDKTPM